jgi:hypothetical protein
MKTKHAERTQDSTPDPITWTCGHCKVRATRMPGFGAGRPEGWTVEKGEVRCLLCRRAAAGERGVEAGEPTSGENMVRMRMASVIEFELDRNADRSNSVIAKVCHTSVPTVVKARNRLGLTAAPAPQSRS